MIPPENVAISNESHVVDIENKGKDTSVSNQNRTAVIFGNEAFTSHWTDSQAPRRGERTHLGTQGLMQSFIEQNIILGPWEGGLDCTMSMYRTMATICAVSMGKERKAISITILCDARISHVSCVKNCRACKIAVITPLLWYNYAAESSRFFTKISLCARYRGTAGKIQNTLYQKYFENSSLGCWHYRSG